MNKEWFIFGNDSHIGPFSKDEILNMYKDEKIFESTLLWREGDEEWLSLDEIELFTNEVLILSSPPELPSLEEPPEVDLPDLPMAKEAEEVLIVESTSRVEEIPSPPTEISIESRETKKVEEVRVEEFKGVGPEEVPAKVIDEETFEDEIVEVDHSQESSNKLHHFTQALGRYSEAPVVLFSCTVLVIAFLLSTTSTLFVKKKSSTHLKNVTVSSISKLNEVIKSDTEQVRSAVALSRDRLFLFSAFNKAGKYNVEASFTALEGKVKSFSPVEFKAFGKLESGIVEFKKINFKRGVKIVDGLYKVKVSARPISRNLDKKRESFTYQGVHLLYPGKDKDFYVEHESFINREKEKKNAFYLDAIEKTKTLNSFIDMTFDEYLDVLNKAFKGSNIKRFEEYFISKVSPIFKEIVLEINRNIINLQQKEDVRVKFFNDLHANYKEFGELVSAFVVETYKKKWIRKKDRKKLEDKFSKEVKALKEKNSNLIKALEKELI